MLGLFFTWDGGHESTLYFLFPEFFIELKDRELRLFFHSYWLNINDAIIKDFVSNMIKELIMNRQLKKEFNAFSLSSKDRHSNISESMPNIAINEFF